MKLELGRSHWKVEDKWHHSWSECIWDEMREGLWAIYKGIEVQEIYLETLNQRNLRNKKSWNIELKKQKVSTFYFLFFLYYGLRVFQFSFQIVCHMAKPHTFTPEVFPFIYTLFDWWLITLWNYKKEWINIG